MGLNDIHSLSHSKWNCKYHIVFGQCQVIVEFLVDKLQSSLTERRPQMSPALVLVAVSCRFLSHCSPVRSPEPPGELSAAP